MNELVAEFKNSEEEEKEADRRRSEAEVTVSSFTEFNLVKDLIRDSRPGQNGRKMNEPIYQVFEKKKNNSNRWVKERTEKKETVKEKEVTVQDRLRSEAKQ
ncbi:hypothetical protein SDJN03_04027, partial [Cucurbita argyrosperma subsp. sororia]